MFFNKYGMASPLLPLQAQFSGINTEYLVAVEILFPKDAKLDIQVAS